MVISKDEFLPNEMIDYELLKFKFEKHKKMFSQFLWKFIEFQF